MGTILWTESQGEEEKRQARGPGPACRAAAARALASAGLQWGHGSPGHVCTRVVLTNNPLSGALVLAALFWASPWQGLLGTVGVLASMFTAVIIGQEGTFLSSGLAPVWDLRDLPVSVYPFNIVIVLYLLVTGPDNPYYPYYPAMPAGELQPNAAELNTAQGPGCELKGGHMHLLTSPQLQVVGAKPVQRALSAVDPATLA
ncbi:unnamed protein product [Lota lota]